MCSVHFLRGPWLGLVWALELNGELDVVGKLSDESFSSQKCRPANIKLKFVPNDRST